MEFKLYDDFPQKDLMVRYAHMSKQFMNKPFNSPLDIVGNFSWHEAFPYERYLFFNQNNEPLVPFGSSKVIDFGCGPGRMVNRALRIFNQVDGIDISGYALDYARKTYPQSNFYESSGLDVGETPSNTYDLVFSTIAIQHIPSKSIRKNIFLGFKDILKDGGWVSFQVAYNPTYKPGKWSADTEHAAYDSDFYDANGTNGHADMVINENSLYQFKNDLSEIFNNVNLTLVNVDQSYANLNGNYHAPYWASDWLFVQGQVNK